MSKIPELKNIKLADMVIKELERRFDTIYTNYRGTYLDRFEPYPLDVAIGIDDADWNPLIVRGREKDKGSYDFWTEYKGHMIMSEEDVDLSRINSSFRAYDFCRQLDRALARALNLYRVEKFKSPLDFEHVAGP